MVKLTRVLRDYRDAGGVNTLIAPWGFLDDTTFVTKSGHVGVVYRLRGRDPEGLLHSERQSVVHQFEAGLRLLDEQCRVYQYLIKSTIDPFIAPPGNRPVAHAALQRRAEYLNGRRQHLYRVDHFVVLLYEAATTVRTSTSLQHVWRAPKDSLRGWLSTAQVCALLERELDRAIALLHQKARAFELHLSECGLTRLFKADAFQFLRRLVNYDPAVAAAAPLKYDTHLDYFAGDSAIECHRDHLLVGSHVVKVLSMKEPPTRTCAHILGDLLAVPGEFIACLDWKRLPTDRERRRIRDRRRHFFNRRVAMSNYVFPDTRPEEMLVDDSATAMVRQLGEALTETEVHGHFFGACSLTLALHGADRRAVQDQVAEATKVFAAHDGGVFEESYNALNAWCAIVPGNSARNIRQRGVLETNLADMSFVFTHDAGDIARVHADREPLAVFETPSQTPYAYHLHVHDVGHTLLLGATGAGKSFLLNFLVTHAQQYDPVTTIIDLGHSYRKLTTLLDGSYVELGLRQQAVTINPFDLDHPSPEQLHFLHAFLRVLLEGDDGYRLSEGEDRETYEALENLFVLDRAQRRLFTVANLLPRALAGRLHKWIEGGRYGALFDHAQDTLTFDRLQVLDLEEMRAYPALLEPLLFYVLHRVHERVVDPAESGTLKLCFMDEAWRLIQHPALRDHVRQALKTWRKHHGALILATHTVDDFASGDLLRTVVEACPTTLFLANPSFDRQRHRELFQMNDQELELLQGLAPRQQILLKRPHLTKVLTLNVDPKSYWIFTNTPLDNARAAAVFREYGFAEGLDRLAASA